MQQDDGAKPLAIIAVRRRLSSLQTGAHMYLFVVLEELKAAGFRVHLVFAPESSFGGLPVALMGASFLDICDRISWRKSIRIGRLVFSLSPGVYLRFLNRLMVELRRKLGEQIPKQPSRASELLPDREARATAALIDAHAPDLVIAEYSALGPLLAMLTTPHATKAVLLHDLFSQRAQAMADMDGPADFTELTLEDEIGLCGAAGLLIYASRREQEKLVPLMADRTHLWLAPRRKTPPKIPPSGQPRALFAGVRHSGNLDAMAFLMDEIWPRVIVLNPDAVLCIAGEIGAHMKPEWRALAGVTILGVVDDLASLGGADTVGLAPTRVASGISIKVMDYMLLEMPVLASRVAVEGYGTMLDDVLQVEDTAEGFATELAGLLASETRRHALAERGHTEGLARLAANNDHVRETLRDLASRKAG